MRIGFPIGIMHFIEIGLFMVMAFMMAAIGKDILAAYQIVYQTFVFIVTLIRGLIQAVTIRIGYEAGRNDKNALKLVVYANVIIGLIFSLAIGLLYFFMPSQIVGFYLNVADPGNKIIIKYALIFLVVIAILQAIDCLRWIFIGILQGLKDTKISMYVSLIGFWVIALPLAYLLGFMLSWGAIGIWIGAIIGILIATMVLIIRYIFLIENIDLKTIVTKSQP
jgi:MATE family multidrug resistance protein